MLDGDRLARVPDKVIAELKGRERNGLVELPPPRGFRCGDPVCITPGVFAGQLGVFDGMRPHERVAVSRRVGAGGHCVGTLSAVPMVCPARFSGHMVLA